MVLRVDFEHFVDSVRRVLTDPVVAVNSQPHGCRITATDKGGTAIVASKSSNPVKSVLDSLKKAGFDVIHGEWTESDADNDSGEFSIAAVAYKSHEPTPGLWLEVFAEKPSKPTVLRSIYDEFCGTGELVGASLEEFVENTHPNVVILSPDQIQRFLDSQSKRL